MKQETPVILCNPGFGNGPYLRAAELALAVAAGIGKPFRIVIPLLYGASQKRILEEEFGTNGAFILDEELGRIIRSLAFEGKSYGDYLKRWLLDADRAGEKARAYIREHYPQVAMEIARSPLLHFNVAPGYCALFGYQSDILRQSALQDAVTVDRDVLRECSEKFLKMESGFTKRFITVPGTFEELHETDTPVPPIIALRKNTVDVPTPSIYVTTSGIAGLSSLAATAGRLGLPVYSNHPEKIPGSRFAPPWIIAHDNIVLHVARAGWGSVWLSLLTETPLLTPAYDPQDDPEIFFNNRRIEELSLGAVDRGQSVEQLQQLQPGIATYKKALQDRFGTLDGAAYTAEKIVAHWRKSA